MLAAPIHRVECRPHCDALAWLDESHSGGAGHDNAPARRAHGRGPSRVTTIEKAEAPGAITLKTLRETAEALDCQFVYAFVPTKALDDILYDQAERKVRNELAHLNPTKRLENQEVNAEDLEGQECRIVADYLAHF